jgi:hypothetical protein
MRHLTRRWKIWLPIVLVIMAVAGGSFAYTYLTATQEIAVTGTGTDIATVTAEGTPSWGALSGQQAGPLPETSLFRITVDSNYTGNLLVSVYLTNSGELATTYQHLNMKMELFDSDGARVGRVEFLTLRNGVVTLQMNYGTGWKAYYLVKITGGSFNTLQGATAGFAPAFYAEVSQR